MSFVNSSQDRPARSDPAPQDDVGTVLPDLGTDSHSVRDEFMADPVGDGSSQAAGSGHVYLVAKETRQRLLSAAR